MVHSKTRNKRIESIKSVLSATNKETTDDDQRPTIMCAACEINCKIRHGERDFWARVEGLAPIYTIRTCPKQTKKEVLGIKPKKRRRK